jgi:hypothetical protein
MPALPAVLTPKDISPPRNMDLRNGESSASSSQTPRLTLPDLKGFLPSVHPLHGNIPSQPPPSPYNFHSTLGRLPSLPPTLRSRRVPFSPPRFSPTLPVPADLPETKPFPLDGPNPTAKELGTPRAYNAEYPHPLSVYASPAVNPATVRDSGYLPLLAELDRRSRLGSIISDCGKDISAPGLMLEPNSKEGCGIPEQYWLRLSAWAGVKVPLGAIVPCVRSRRFSLAEDMHHSRSETDLHSYRSMGPRRGEWTLPCC